MKTDNKLWRNRKARKELARRLQTENPGLEVVHAHAGGIDVGNSAHYAAVRPDRDPQPVRRFECFTADLHRLADWLQSCGVKTVALQSTGVYWIPLYDILRQQRLVGLVARGLTNKEIASHLNLSEFTVRNHIHRILKQVDAGSRSEAVETIRAYGYPISP